MPMTTMRRAEITFGAGLLGLIVLGGLLGEGILRVREALRFDWRELNTSIMYRDAERDFLRFTQNTSFEHVNINSFGLPGPEIDVPKPRDTLRLAFLGDSTFLGTSLAPEDRVPVQVTSHVARAFPNCNVDWISISGPSYAFKQTTAILSDVQPVTQPDAFILMLGSLTETLQQVEATAAPNRSYFQNRNADQSASLLLTKMRQAYAALQDSNGVDDTDLLERLDLNLLQQVLVENIDRLAETIGPSPTILIENRGRERDDMDAKTLALIRRVLLSKFDGLDASGLVRLREIMRNSLNTSARKNGWGYIDPLADMAPTNRYFDGPVHLTAEGINTVAPKFAEAIISQIENAEFQIEGLE